MRNPTPQEIKNAELAAKQQTKKNIHIATVLLIVSLFFGIFLFVDVLQHGQNLGFKILLLILCVLGALFCVREIVQSNKVVVLFKNGQFWVYEFVATQVKNNPQLINMDSITDFW